MPNLKGSPKYLRKDKLIYFYFLPKFTFLLTSRDGLPGPDAPALLLGHEPLEARGVLPSLNLLVPTVFSKLHTRDQIK